MLTSTACCRVAGGSAAVGLVDLSELNPQVVSEGDAYRAGKLAAFMFYQFALGRAEAVARGEFVKGGREPRFA